MRRAGSKQKSCRRIASTTSRRWRLTRASWRESSRGDGLARVVENLPRAAVLPNPPGQPPLLVGPQLDRVAVGVEDPELAARTQVGGGFEKLDAHILERALGLIEVGHLEGDVRTQRIGL